MKNILLAFILVLVLAFGVSAQTTSKVVPLAVVTYDETWTDPTVSFSVSETNFGVRTHFNVQGTTIISHIKYCIYKSGELVGTGKLVGMAPYTEDGDYEESVLLPLPDVPGIYKIEVKIRYGESYSKAITKTLTCKIHLY
jgi:hypothetical protein